MVTRVEGPPEPPERLTDPRGLLTGYLDYYRDALLRKLDGLPDEQLRTSVLPSGWTPLELFKHLTYVELRWLRWGFTGEAVPEPWGDRDATGERWHVPENETFEELKAAFLDNAERCRQIVATARLDDFGKPYGRFENPEDAPSLIWILFHLIQEYARHLGQLDVVRELLDGAIGE